jgi:hypothetical protein
MNKPELQEKLQFFKNEDETLSVELYFQYRDELGNIKTYLPAAEERVLSVALSSLVKATIKSKFFLST